MFLVVCLYVIASVIIFLGKDHIKGYRVLTGSLSSDNIYEAIALRTESTVEATTAGYVNYFATEGGRVAVGDLVYTIDESGQLLDYLKSQGSEEVSLSNEDLSELRAQIVDYTSGFNSSEFYTVYDFKTSVDGTVQKLSNNNILNNIQSLDGAGSTLSSINYLTATQTGIIVYSTDGYENKTVRDLTAEDFDNSDYEKTQLINNTLVEAGDTVYKICTDESWSIVIKENDEDKVQELVDLEYVKVRFLKNQYESWGKVSTYTNDAGDTFVELTFSNSMLTFCKDRYLNVELITEEQSGLKIPNSSIAEKTFYIVPKEYVTKSENDDGVLRVSYDEQGNETTEFVATEIYSETDSEYYLDDSTLRSGDTLVMPESSERFTVSAKDTLIGVYNINKGYSEFRQISILYQNDEYAIVKSNTTYGLNEYDYIVLDAAAVDGATVVETEETDSKNSKSEDSESEDQNESDDSDNADSEEITDDSAAEESTENVETETEEDNANSVDTADNADGSTEEASADTTETTEATQDSTTDNTSSETISWEVNTTN